MSHSGKRLTAILLAAIAAGACSEGPVAVPASKDIESTAQFEQPSYSNGIIEAPRKIAMRDDCMASDPAWPGGCSLETGSVTFLQFAAVLPKGHPAWRNEPSYLKVKDDKNIKISNEGGRPHTFTRVAQYGNGIVPTANRPGEAIAPECLNTATRLASLLAPGQSSEVQPLEPGIHKFMCCFHPWMIAEIRVL